jgi:hypothetical protein
LPCTDGILINAKSRRTKIKLIKEHTEEVKLIVEANESGNGKNYFIEGVFLQSNLKNRNGRMYPKEILQNEVDRYNKEYTAKNRAFGELGHPDSPTINLDRVSHMIKTLKLEGNNFVGRAKIMDTPYGKIVKSLIDEGAQLGVSSRGMGSIIQKGGMNLVQPDFMLATAADIVADPSAPDAFVEGIMEGREWIYNASTKSWMIAEQIKSDIQKMTAKQVAENQARMFDTFLNSLT